jgi:hypothetical protein
MMTEIVASRPRSLLVCLAVIGIFDSIHLLKQIGSKRKLWTPRSKRSVNSRYLTDGARERETAGFWSSDNQVSTDRTILSVVSSLGVKEKEETEFISGHPLGGLRRPYLRLAASEHKVGGPVAETSQIVTGFIFRCSLLDTNNKVSAPGLGNYISEFVKEIRADADFLFRAIDTDKSGSISKKELQEHLKRVSNYTSAAVDNIFAALTLNDGGESSKLGISKDDLRDAFIRNSASRQAIGEEPNYK